MQKKILLISLFYTLVRSAILQPQSELSSLWQAWKTLHKKTYNLLEETERLNIFLDNYDKILRFNSQNESPKLALNKFADLTAQEFKSKHSGCAFSHDDEAFIKSNTKEHIQDPLPDSIDWRKKGAVYMVSDQGSCGACWAFAAVAAVEGFHAIQTGSILGFSEQQLIDCDLNNRGCGGGWPYLGLVYTAQYGDYSHYDYPYTGNEGNCMYNPQKATRSNTGFQFVAPKNSTALKSALTVNPVAVLIESDEDVFQFYQSGVITANCSSNVDHAVLAVGYTTINGTEAFIVKNSWGTNWGQAGYAYIATDPSQNNGTGVCGILTQPSIPV